MKYNYCYKWFIFIFCILSCCSEGQCARILGISLPGMKSHQNLMLKLLKELVRRGHDVTYVNPFEDAHPMENFREVIMPWPAAAASKFRSELHQHLGVSSIQELYKLLPPVKLYTIAYLNYTSVQTFLKSDEKFDLVIQDSVNDYSLIGFAHQYGAKLIIFSTLPFEGWLQPYTNLVYPSSYIPQYSSGYSGEMTFLQRAHNAIISLVTHRLLNQGFQAQNEVLHMFWPDAPDLLKLIKDRTALVLLNSHYSFTVPRPSVPNVIEIGGYHIEKPKELPENLKHFLDSAENGAILFSLGSLLSYSSLPIEAQKIFLEVFRKLPYKILWKVDADIPGKPDNVLLDKWLPQNDILAHPNIKLFMTHGGLLSTTESIYHAVPFIGFPVFSDQKTNLAFAEQVGIGKAIYFNKLTSDLLFNTIQELLDNPIYRENIQQRSIMLRDQPMPPLDKAMYWIEYVLKYNSTKHLHTGIEYLELYEVMLLDVIAVALIILLSVAFVLYIICKKIIRQIRQKPGSEDSKKNK